MFHSYQSTSQLLQDAAGCLIYPQRVARCLFLQDGPQLLQVLLLLRRPVEHQTIHSSLAWAKSMGNTASDVAMSSPGESGTKTCLKHETWRYFTTKHDESIGYIIGYDGDTLCKSNIAIQTSLSIDILTKNHLYMVDFSASHVWLPMGYIPWRL